MGTEVESRARKRSACFSLVWIGGSAWGDVRKDGVLGNKGLVLCGAMGMKPSVGQTIRTEDCILCHTVAKFARKLSSRIHSAPAAAVESAEQ